MDSFEINKILMALGFAVLSLFAINEVGNAIFHVDAPETPGYAVEVAAEDGEHGGTETAAPADTLPDFGTVLASADVAAGERVASRCTQCHTWDKGGANKIGPNLWGVVGGPHAHKDDFSYSAAMKAEEGGWTYAALYEFLRKPNAAVPGTKMSFAGLSKSEDRINLIAFMRTWADTPQPLPAPNPAAAPEEASAPDAAPEGGEAPAAPHE